MAGSLAHLGTPLRATVREYVDFTCSLFVHQHPPSIYQPLCKSNQYLSHLYCT